MPLDLPEPWGRFLRDLDARLRTPVALHCLGQTPAEAAGRIVAGIHYDNFKSAVGERQGAAREDVYHRVWHELPAIQRSTRSRSR
jgi:hypothetical protein